MSFTCEDFWMILLFLSDGIVSQIKRNLINKNAQLNTMTIFYVYPKMISSNTKWLYYKLLIIVIINYVTIILTTT